VGFWSGVFSNFVHCLEFGVLNGLNVDIWLIGDNAKSVLQYHFVHY
jgi:hypothetical protein